MSAIEQDEEEQQNLMNCLDLLVAAGYFRARIKGLATFDKIVGGMVWCLSYCNRAVDADLLFSENLDIGQKIMLTEKIVRVLADVECPHSIEPHQIQGLDITNIYPVIQWLVKVAMESKTNRANSLKSYIDYQYCKIARKNAPTSVYCDIYEDVHEKIMPRRRFKRGKNLHFDTLLEDAQCTLAEFSDRSTVEPKHGGNSNESTLTTSVRPSALEGLSGKGLSKVSTRTAKKIFFSIDEKSEQTSEDTTCMDNVDSWSDVQEDKVRKVLHDLDEALAIKKKQLDEATADYDAQLKKQFEVEEVLSRFSTKEIEEARTLLNEYETVKENERYFKLSSEAQLSSLIDEIQSYQNITVQSDTPDSEEAVKELSSERLKLAEASKHFAALMYEFDSVPSQSELSQYQQRFIELFNQIESKHRHARQYITLYNTLVDVRNYIKKDIELLSKIEDILPLATKASFRDSFIDNLNNIFQAVESVHNKATERTTALTAEKNRLLIEYNQLKERSRRFDTVVDQLTLVSCGVYIAD
ncbi:hypothetical protein DICVIV_02431 [Dictyocaulus viviparus]|uniref:Coiled-coil domain-containing protein 93 n=1 Tax=Dictyocaulus viviparus TaxID=29172 RepID=A0A0D8Y5F1_DICVI|nr:hypothetical protein DICVIV_02431 [Dictyocaulus viviparus]